MVLGMSTRYKTWKGVSIMRKFSYVVLTIALLPVIVYLSSCAGTGVIDRTDPLIPLPELKEGTVDPATRAITITKDNITVTVEHWSRTRLNRKYTNVDTRSPFYYLETWSQSFQAEVFHVTIKNDRTKSVVVDFKETSLEDTREYVYKPIEDDFYKYKFVTKKMMDLKTKKGLRLISQIVLKDILGKDGAVPPGETRAGFIPFNTPSTQAETVWLKLVLEKEPEVPTGSYEPIEFKFDYIQDLVLRRIQPSVKR